MTDVQEQDGRQEEQDGRQKEQAVLVKEGERLAGVAEALAAYRAFAPYVPAAASPATPVVVYGTGGNA